jgi:hypothetical protein
LLAKHFGQNDSETFLLEREENKNKNTVLVLVPVRTKKWYRVQTRIKNITEEEKRKTKTAYRSELQKPHSRVKKTKKINQIHSHF